MYVCAINFSVKKWSRDQNFQDQKNSSDRLLLQPGSSPERYPKSGVPHVGYDYRSHYVSYVYQ